MTNVQIYKSPPHIFVLALTVSEVKISNYLPLKSRSRSRSTLFTITTFDGNCQNLQISPTHFCGRSYRFRDIKKLICYLQKVDQGHRVQFFKLHYSMAYQNLLMSSVHFLCWLLPFQRYKIVKYFVSRKQVKVTDSNYLNCNIRWQMLNSTNVSHTFLF